MEYDPAEVPTLIEPIERGVADVVYGSRLARRPAAAGVPLLAPRRQPLPVACVTGRALQHDALGHGDRLQGVPVRRPPLARPARERLRDRAGDHRQDLQAASCASTSCRSPTTAARYDEGKKITWRDGFKALWVLFRVRFEPAGRRRAANRTHARRQERRRRRAGAQRGGADRRDAAGDPGLRRPDLRRRRRLDRRDGRARPRGSTIPASS